MVHEELPSYRYSFTCSCGKSKAGTADKPELFSDHLMEVLIETTGR